MAPKSKAYRAAVDLMEPGKFYSTDEAVAIVKETGSKKFDSTVEVALKLGVDPRKADQMVRSTVILPHGTGKTARVIVFATGPAAEAAIAAGADEVGGAELIEKVDRDKLYAPLDAVRLAKSTSTTKYDATVEVAFRLGVDPRKADQMVRGTVILPHGTGKTARVIVFATGPAAEAAIAAGADEVGGAELIEKVAGGYVGFDAAVSTPELMGQVGRLGKVLGPRNLMPNPKTGTVTPDPAKAVLDIKGGKIEFRVDKHANLHFVIGKAGFTKEQLNENLQAALDEIQRTKPSSSKGRYIQKGSLSTTFGPGVPLDTSVL